MSKNSHNRSNNQESGKSKNLNTQESISKVSSKNSSQKSDSKKAKVQAQKAKNPNQVVPKLVLTNGPKDLLLTASTRNPIKGFRFTYEKELKIPLDSFGNKARLFSFIVPVLNAHFSGADLSTTFKNLKGTNMDANKSTDLADDNAKDPVNKAPDLSTIKDEKLRSLVESYRNADCHSKKVLAGIALTNYQIKLSEISKFRQLVLISMKDYSKQIYKSKKSDYNDFVRSFVSFFGSVLLSSYSDRVGEQLSEKHLIDSYVFPIMQDKFEIVQNNLGNYELKLKTKKATDEQSERK